MEFLQYSVIPFGFSLYSIGEYQVGWAIRLARKDFSVVGWETAVRREMLDTLASHNDEISPEHFEYVWSSLQAEGIHEYDGDHPRLWDWDYCTHPDGHCALCDYILVISYR